MFISAFRSFFDTISKRIRTGLATLLNTTTTRADLDLQQLKITLLQADIDLATTTWIVDYLQKLPAQTALKPALDHLLQTIITQGSLETPRPDIILMVGVNGVGKTTTAAKLAYFYTTELKRTPLLVAADTFRAAAQDQLRSWAEKLSLPFLGARDQEKDPGAVVYRSLRALSNKECDLLIIDTSGRMHTHDNLMHEIKRLRALIAKQAPQATVMTYLTIDSTLGSNSLHQAQIFHEALKLQGIIVTKMDSQAKGGMLISIAHHTHIPIIALTQGQQAQDLVPFHTTTFIESILS